MSGGLDRQQAMSRTFEFRYKSGIEGDYYEFGAYQGLSLVRAMKADRFFSKRLERPTCERYVVFDSFVGLPALSSKDALGGYTEFHEGQFAASQQEVMDAVRNAGEDTCKIVCISGFYETSLTDPKTSERLENSKAAIVHLDCDLYTSAQYALAFITDRLQDGAVLLFDDWFCYRGRADRGVRRAFEEWRDSTGYSAAEYFTYSWAGKAFIVNLP